MSVSMESLGLNRLDVDERLALIDELWESIIADGGVPPIGPAKRAELRRRVQEHLENPDDVVAWEEIEASINERLRQ